MARVRLSNAGKGSNRPNSLFASSDQFDERTKQAEGFRKKSLQDFSSQEIFADDQKRKSSYGGETQHVANQNVANQQPMRREKGQMRRSNSISAPGQDAYRKSSTTHPKNVSVSGGGEENDENQKPLKKISQSSFQRNTALRKSTSRDKPSQSQLYSLFELSKTYSMNREKYVQDYVDNQKPTVSVEKPNVSVEKPNVSVEKPNVSVEKPNVFADTQKANVGRPKIVILSEGELKQFCRYFWRSDINGSGKLTVYDFSKLIEHLGMKLSKQALQKAFKAADVDQDGLISFNDFSITYLNRDAYTFISPEQIQEYFVKTNHTGAISLTKLECLQIINLLGNDSGEKKFERVMRAMMDKENNDQITLSKFYSFLGLHW